MLSWLRSAESFSFLSFASELNKLNRFERVPRGSKGFQGICMASESEETRRELLLEGGLRWAMGETPETQAVLAEHLRPWNFCSGILWIRCQHWQCGYLINLIYDYIKYIFCLILITSHGLIWSKAFSSVSRKLTLVILGRFRAFATSSYTMLPDSARLLASKRERFGNACGWQSDRWILRNLTVPWSPPLTVWNVERCHTMLLHVHVMLFPKSY